METSITILLIGLLITYMILMISFLYGWKNLDIATPSKHTLAINFSIIIPVRNEQNNILKILHTLKMQNYDLNYYEIIVVDDHSVDDTFQTVQKFKNKHEDLHVKLYSLGETESSKKAAIKMGIKAASGEVVIMTDADCSFRFNYLKTVNEYYRKQSALLLIGPVRMQLNKNILTQWQALEFSSLIFTAAGSAGIHQPLLANGANLIIDRSILLVNNKQDVFLDKYASGDDMFLLHFVKKNYGNRSVSFINNPEAIADTTPAASVQDFFHQRKRWVSKSKGYKSPALIVTAVVIFLTCLVQILSIPALFFTQINYYVIGVFWTVKLLIDFLTLNAVTRFLQQQIIMRWYLPVALIYPFYVVILSFTGLFTTYQWKSRKY